MEDITTVVTGAFVGLCCVVAWVVIKRKSARRGAQDSTPKREGLTLRNHAAFALTCYWSHYYEGWSLVLFRDGSGAVRHVACEVPDGTYFDSGGNCSVDQIVQRLRVSVTAESCDETDVQSLMDSNVAVLEAAEEFRNRVEHKAA